MRRTYALRGELLESRHLLATLGGKVFVDSNADGFKRFDEPAHAGMSVFLDLNQNGLLDDGEPEQISDAAGDYVFTDLPAGSYSVVAVETNQLRQVSPATREEAGTLIEVEELTDHVHDPLRQIIYLATENGIIERYDIESDSFLEPIQVGAWLTAIDITPDYRYIYAGEAFPGTRESLIYKIDLADLSIQTLAVPSSVFPGGIYDLATTSNDKVIFSTDYDSTLTPLGEIDVATNAIQSRDDFPATGSAVIEKNRDATKLVVRTSNVRPFLATTYDSVSDTFQAPIEVEDQGFSTNVAINPTGTRIAQEATSYPLGIYDTDLELLFEIGTHRNGVVFDPLRNVIYAADGSRDDIWAYRASFRLLLYQMDIGNNLSISSRHREMKISPEGRFLSLNVGVGVRLFDIARPVARLISLSEGQTKLDVRFGIAKFDFPPVANSDEFLVEPEAITEMLDVLSNDRISPVTEVVDVSASQAGGSVQLVGGDVIYAPPSPYRGIDQFSYVVEDDLGRRSTATATVTVKPRNGLADLTGTVWHDFDLNGRRDPGEPGLPGKTVYVDTNENSQHDPGEPIQTSAADGSYQFHDLLPGPHMVRAELETNERLTNVTNGSDQFLLSGLNGLDFAFDDQRELLLIAGEDGNLLRYDLDRESFLSPWPIGLDLRGLDLSADGRFAYVGEAISGTSFGKVYRVNLDTAEVDPFEYQREQSEAGVFDLATTNNGKLFFTSDSLGTSEVSLPLREIDLQSGVVQTRGGQPLVPRSKIERSADRSTLLIMPDSESATNLIYHGDTDTIVADTVVFDNERVSGAVAPDGRVIAWDHLLLDSTLHTTTVLSPQFNAGLTFDPVRNVLVVGAANTDEIISFDLSTGSIADRIDLPDNLARGHVPMAVSGNGRYLALDAPSGIRLIEFGSEPQIPSALAANWFVNTTGFGVVASFTAPSATDDDFTVPVGTVDFPLDVLANDDLADAGSYSLGEMYADETVGSVRIVDSQIHYTAAPGFRGVDSFVYTVLNESGVHRAATVTVTVRTVDGSGDITGLAWDDFDLDGKYDPQQGETTLSGTTVFLDLNQNGMFDAGEPSQQTSLEGTYQFQGLTPGTYRVRQDLPDPIVPTFPAIAGFENELIQVRVASDYVFDQQRGMLYIGGIDGLLYRYDLTQRTLLEPWPIGFELSGIDITPDGRYLFAGESAPGATSSFLYKVDLDSGVVEKLLFAQGEWEAGVYDLAISASGRVLFTTDSRVGSSVFLREVDPATDEIAIRIDKPLVAPRTTITRSADHETLFVVENGTRSIASYDATTNTFSVHAFTNDEANDANVAVSHDGTWVIRDSQLFNANLEFAGDFGDQYDAGITFDPRSDILYAGISSANVVAAIDIHTGDELYRMFLGEIISAGMTQISLSSDGRYLVYPTALGLRLVGLRGDGEHRVDVLPNRIHESIDFGSVEAPTAPVAVDDNYVVNPNPSSFLFDVLSNDSTESSIITSVTQPEVGSVTIVGDQLQYTRPAGFEGVTSFQYTLRNTYGQQRVANVTVVSRFNPGQGDIEGVVWDDTNTNGVFEPELGELPLEGQRIYLDANGDQQWTAGEPMRLSGADGSYSFANLDPNTYQVRQDLTPNRMTTLPAGPGGPTESLSISASEYHVFDPRRNMLYITTRLGTLERYDLRRHEFLESWQVGRTLSAADITPDGQYLYVGESDTRDDQGFVYRVNLDDGSIETITYQLRLYEYGVWDVAIAGNGKAFFTTRGTTSSLKPLREIDLATGLSSQRFDVGNNSSLGRSKDYSTIVVTQTARGTISKYDAASDSFAHKETYTFFTVTTAPAVNHDGTGFAIDDSRLNSDFETIHISPNRYFGYAFDPIRPILYGLDVATDELVAANADTFDEIYRVALDANVHSLQGKISVSPDGRLLFASTNDGVWWFDLGQGAHEVTVEPNSFTRDLNFGSTALAPPLVLNNDEYVIPPNSGATELNVLLNDSELAGGFITWSSQPSAGGTVSAHTTHLSYTPAPGFRGLEQFYYRVEAGGQHRAGLVTVHVKPDNGLADISGFAWYDVDRDGRYASTAISAALGGHEIYLDLNENGLFDAGEPLTQTDANGFYAFLDITPGEYHVRQALPDDWVPTTPLGPPRYRETIATDVLDQAFDPVRNRLYLSSGTRIRRYDLATNSFLSDIEIGTDVSAIDVTLDGTYLFVGDPVIEESLGTIRRVRLDTGEIDAFQYPVIPLERGIFDLAATSAGTVFFTTNLAGSGSNPLREIDAETGVITTHFDVRQSTKIERNSSYSNLLFLEANINSGPIVSYDVQTGEFVHGSAGGFLSNVNGATGPCGHLHLVRDYIYDENLLRVAQLPISRIGAAAFAPFTKTLYVVDTDLDAIVEYDTETWERGFRWPIQQDFAPGRNTLTVSDNGAWLFLTNDADDVLLFNRTTEDSHIVTAVPNQVAPGGDFGSFDPHAGNVVGRQLFYNDSVFDGNVAANEADDLAIATDKSPLLPDSGWSTFENYSSSPQGITGVMVDLINLPSGNDLSVETDFEFRVGNSNSPDDWRLLQGDELPTMSIRRDTGASCHARISLIWPSGSVVNQWLEVTVKATPNTQLQVDDVFYYGNAPGEATGYFDEATSVNATDFIATRVNPANFLNPAEVTNRHDFNRDGRVDAIDMLIVRDHATSMAQSLQHIAPKTKLISPPGVSKGRTSDLRDFGFPDNPAKLTNGHSNNDGFEFLLESSGNGDYEDTVDRLLAAHMAEVLTMYTSAVVYSTSIESEPANEIGLNNKERDLLLDIIAHDFPTAKEAFSAAFTHLRRESKY